MTQIPPKKERNLGGGRKVGARLKICFKRGGRPGYLY
jgi:hypothetical protein